MLKKKRSNVIIAMMLFSSAACAQIDSVLATQLQQILNSRVQNSGNNGVSACVILPDGGIWKGTAGVGEGNLAITDSTVFHGASVTKTAIAVLILLLAENGLLHLDSSWQNYVSLNVNFDSTITIRQLLSHTSGIADYLEAPGSGSYVTSDFNRAFTPVEILENIVSGIPDFAPGTGFSYSSSNYVLAALIAQTITGNPVQQELRTRIWDVLGMTNTYFGGFESYTEPRAGVWWNFGSGLVNYSNNPKTSMLTFGYGGANLVSTPEDLARFARALFTGNFLTPASLNEMQVFNANSYSTWTAGYGLGIHNAYLFGNNSVLGHDGYYTNMADMFHSFDYGFTLVTMSNTERQWFAIFNQMYNTIVNHISVDIKENAVSSSINLFPNPTTGHCMLTLGDISGRVEVVITDLAGKAISTMESTDTRLIEVDTKEMEAGVYAVRIQTAEFIVTKKLIVTK